MPHTEVGLRLKGARWLRLWAVALAAACSSDSPGPAVAVASVEVSPASAPVSAGSTLQLTAVPKDSAGASLNGRTITWSSNASAIATVSGTGLVSGKSPGAATITATSEGKSGSADINVTAGPATHLVFTVLPGSAIAGVPFVPSIQVTAQDALGNTATAFVGNVTVALAANPGGATLSGTTTVGAGAGVATFPGLSLERSGSGYTFSATATGLTVATSATLTVVGGTATQLSFSVQPTTTVAASAISPAVGVTALDVFGNTAAGFTGAVTIGLGANPSGATLSGTLTRAAASGVVSFDDLQLNKSGAGYTLAATAGGLTGDTSLPFNVTSGPVSATQSGVGVSPGTITASAGGSTTTITVTARDASGNPVQGATVTVAVTGTGNTLTQPAGVTNSSGIATGTLSSTVAEAKIVSAMIGAVTVTQTDTVTVNAAAATVLAFTTQPANTGAGDPIAPPVTAVARDAFGNTATGFTSNVTAAIASNPSGGALSGTKVRAAVAGLATFSDLNIDKVGVGYTLRVSASGLTPDTSAAFAITLGTVSTAQSTVQAAPTSIAASAGSSASTITVTAKDGAGNPIPGATVVLSATGSGNVLTQPAGTTDGLGVATGRLSSTVAEAKIVSATINGIAVIQTDTVTVTPGSATALAFTTQPSNTVAGATITPSVQVSARDGFGNTATGFSGSVTVAILTNPAGGTLGGTKTRTATSGVATFNNLSIDNPGTGYQLTATASGLSSASSASFDITVGPPAQVAFVVQPTNVTAGAAITPPLQVQIQDAGGHLVSNATNSVTVSIAANPGSGALSGTATRSAVSGVASFPGLSIDKSGTGYTLQAAATGLTPDISATFNVAAGSASLLVFTVQPSNTTGGIAIAPAVQVSAEDALGNVATTFAGNITIALGANPGGGSLTGTTVVPASAGVASFSTLKIDSAAGNYTLTAAAGGVSGVTSNSFDVAVGPAARLTLTAPPRDTVAGAHLNGSGGVQVTATDAGGNLATAFTNNVTVALVANPGGGTLSGTKTVGAVSGVATFTTLSITKVAVGYTIQASSGALTRDTSGTFSISPAAVSASHSSLDVSADTIGQCLVTCPLVFGATTITVTARDQFDNVVPNAAVSLSAAPASVDSNRFTSPGATGTTNVAGVFTAQFNSAQAQSKTVTAVAGGTAISQTGAVAVMPVLLAAGDIADCGNTSDDATAGMLDSMPGVVLALGDNAYPNGTATDYSTCYTPTWGRPGIKARTRPIPGNHEYDNSATAAGYVAYFSAPVADPLGTGGYYYSFGVGSWHLVALNSEIAMTAGSAQEQWLRQDLAGRTGQCVLAYWHRPRFTAGPAGDRPATQPVWKALFDSSAEVVLGGHDHNYERYAVLNDAGQPVSSGLREFVIGNGGGESLINSYPGLGPPSPVVHDNTTFGLFRLTLLPNSYRWEFIPAPGFGSFAETGTGSCN